jgi:SAM-dependent methyltransferase
LRVAARHNCSTSRLSTQVCRVRQLNAIEGGSIDLILSGSVLEHVSDPLALFAQLRRLLVPGGAMLHIVDYRDHFFKYPYHFLQFRKATWNRWLNPGDLPVWRLYDHLDQLKAAGFSTRVLAESRDREAYAAIAAHVSSDYNRDDERLQATFAALWAVANTV